MKSDRSDEGIGTALPEPFWGALMFIQRAQRSLALGRFLAKTGLFSVEMKMALRDGGRVMLSICPVPNFFLTGERHH